MNTINTFPLTIIFDNQPLTEANMAGFVDIIKNKFTIESDGGEGRNMEFKPYITTDIIDVPLVEGEKLLCLHATTLSILKSACPLPITGNDFTILDYAAVEINNSKMSTAVSVLICTEQSYKNVLAWHEKNGTDIQFKRLFLYVPTNEELLEEDEFFVLKYFGPNENTRLLAIETILDDDDDKHIQQVKIAASPHIPLRCKRVRKSIIAMSQDNFFVDHRYKQED